VTGPADHSRRHVHPPRLQVYLEPQNGQALADPLSRREHEAKECRNVSGKRHIILIRGFEQKNTLVESKRPGLLRRTTTEPVGVANRVAWKSAASGGLTTKRDRVQPFQERP